MYVSAPCALVGTPRRSLLTFPKAMNSIGIVWTFSRSHVVQREMMLAVMLTMAYKWTKWIDRVWQRFWMFVSGAVCVLKRRYSSIYELCLWHIGGWVLWVYVCLCDSFSGCVCVCFVFVMTAINYATLFVFKTYPLRARCLCIYYYYEFWGQFGFSILWGGVCVCAVRSLSVCDVKSH